MSIIAQVKGGLGNQMFIYATARALSLRNSVPLKLDPAFTYYKSNPFNLTFLLDHFNICATIANAQESFNYFGGKGVRWGLSIFSSVLPYNKRMILRESINAFIPELCRQQFQSIYLMGYWQSYRYFSDMLPQLKKELTKN